MGKGRQAPPRKATIDGALAAELERIGDTLYTPDEEKALLMSLLRQRGSRGASEQEAADLLSWAREVALWATLIDAAIDGSLMLGWEGGEAVVEGVRP